ncbi:MAG: hypothetical protein LBS90_05805, partial [Oscillospiraceae bacterium]|nr:hypothetical protein [Oscillospiraceae bacterium]
MTFKEEYTRENEEIRVSGGLQNKIIKENHKMKSTRRFGWKQGISAAAAIALVCVIAVIGAGKPAPANAFSFTANEADVPPDFKLNVPAELEINFENFVGQVVYGVTYDELRSSFSKTHSLYAFNISGENVEKVELSATSGTFVFGEGAEVTEQDGKFTVSGTTASLVVWTSDD